MVQPFLKTILRGISFLRENPQVAYTAFLLVAIPAAFIASGQKFLEVSSLNQERMEKERIGILNDALVILAREKLAEPMSLQPLVEEFREAGNGLVAIRIFLYENGIPVIAASLDRDEIGTYGSRDDDLDFAALRVEDTKIIPTMEQGGERRWKTVRGITTENGTIAGVVVTEVSMAHIDRFVAQNIRGAYLFLSLIIAALVFLLLRQARFIEYGVLYRRLKEIDRMKDDFISMAAHELRTPLSVIRGYLGMISPDRLNAEDREGLTRVNASVENLGSLVNDILDVVRIEEGRITFDKKTADHTPLIGETVSSLEYLAREKKLSLSFAPGPSAPFSADPARLRQVLTNLIGNAIKYTFSGGVTVTTETDGHTMSIRIRDTGIGISAEDQKRLFEKFFRVRSKETEDVRGTGLGLWIAGNIVTKMNGSISVESIRGKGSDFIISFPVISRETS